MAGCAGKLRIEASTTLHSHTAILLHLHKNRTLVRILFTNSGAPRLSFRVTMPVQISTSVVTEFGVVTAGTN